MKSTKILISSIIFTCFFAICSIAIINNVSFAENNTAQNFKIFATSDIHSYFNKTTDINEKDQIAEHGDATKVATMLNERRGNDSIYVDAGDFSMGTLIQTGFTKHAYELRLLGELGCDVTTFGNHEFDQGPDGLADMLNNAKASGDKLPSIVQSNIVFNSENELKKSFDNYGVQKYIIKEINGVKVGVFGLEGIDSLDCAPTNNQEWQNYIDGAKQTVKEMEGKVDFILCLSHGGTKDNGDSGEDVELLKQVPQINLCISGHTHSSFEPKKIGDSYIVAPGCYLYNISQLNMEKTSDGKWQVNYYDNIPTSGNINSNTQIQNKLNAFDNEIKKEYLNEYANGDATEDVICQNPYVYKNMSSVSKSTEEVAEQNLIADSYKFAAKQCGIDDVDITINGMGTVRATLAQGPITVSDAFNICSLGASEDKTSGHPLCAVYINGKDLKLFVEVETSLGPLKDGMKIAYNGLKVTWNQNRFLMDKVTDVKIAKDDGTIQEIDDDKLYKVVTNLYSLNMLSSLNKLSMGILKITPKDADGNPVEDYYKTAIKLDNGKDLKEWVAFKDYLKSLKTIPEKYSGPLDRKVNTNESGLAIFANPGPATIFITLFILVIVLFVILIIRTIIKKIHRHQQAKK